jgi:O-antigen ligase
MFGLGFDEILNDRMDTPLTIIRYPHNSFLSVFGFTGIVGLVLYLSLVGVIFLKIYKSLRFGNEIPLLRWYPLFAIGYFVSAFFSTVFEAPFHSYVFWVLSGIFYRIAIHKDLTGGFYTSSVVRE